MVQTTTSRRLRCRDCKAPLASPLSAYWYDLNGRRLKVPRCLECHEKLVRQSAVQPRPIFNILAVFPDQNRYKRSRTK